MTIQTFITLLTSHYFKLTISTVYPKFRISIKLCSASVRYLF